MSAKPARRGGQLTASANRHGHSRQLRSICPLRARESAYSGQEITWDQIIASILDLFPKSFDYDLPMGVPPLPVPGSVQVLVIYPALAVALISIVSAEWPQAGGPDGSWRVHGPSAAIECSVALN
jgi:hypothetical protein